MVKIDENKLIIEISHPCPEDFLNDLKEAIISTIQNQQVDVVDMGKVQERNVILLELLKSLL